MAEKKKPQNKSEKKTTATKKAAPIDWDAQPETVVIIAGKHKHLEEGKEYPVTKETAKLFIEIGCGTLK